jgi:hypothetical protein
MPSKLLDIPERTKNLDDFSWAQRVLNVRRFAVTGARPILSEFVVLERVKSPG